MFVVDMATGRSGGDDDALVESRADTSSHSSGRVATGGSSTTTAIKSRVELVSRFYPDDPEAKVTKWLAKTEQIGRMPT